MQRQKREEVKYALEACKLKSGTGQTSKTVFKAVVSHKPNGSALFTDSHITYVEISHTDNIFGPSLPYRKGKWVPGK